MFKIFRPFIKMWPWGKKPEPPQIKSIETSPEDEETKIDVESLRGRKKHRVMTAGGHVYYSSWYRDPVFDGYRRIRQKPEFRCIDKNGRSTIKPKSWVDDYIKEKNAKKEQEKTIEEDGQVQVETRKHDSPTPRKKGRVRGRTNSVHASEDVHS